MARSAAQDPLRLLVVASEADAGEAVAAVLRQEGRAVRLVRTYDPEQIDELLQSGMDEVLVGLLPGRTPTDLIKNIAARIARIDNTISLVAWISGETAAAQLDMLAAGARRTTLLNSATLTAAVIRSEWDGVKARRDQRDLGARLTAAYARCNALIDSARDPLAYFHEGIFLRGNAAWRELMRAKSDEDLEGSSLLDLVSSGGTDAVEQMRTLLKSARNSRLSGDTLRDLHVDLTTLNDTTVSGNLEVTAAEYDDEPCLQAIFTPDKIESAILVTAIASTAISAQEPVRTAMVQDSLLPESVIRPGNGRRAVLDLVPSLCRHPNVKNPVALFVGMHQQGTTLVRVGVNRVDDLDTLIRARLEAVLGQHHIQVAKTETELTGSNAAAIVAPFGDHWIVLGHLDNSEKAIGIAKDLASAFAHSAVDLGGHSLVVGLSVGGSLLDRETGEPAEVKEGAMATHTGSSRGFSASLSKGWGRFQDAMSRGAGMALVHDPHAADNAEILKKMAMHEAIREAMTHDRFLIRYQPLISLNGSETDTYEMLVHVADPQGGAPLAYGSWLSDSPDIQQEVDRWVISQALTRLAKKSGSRRKIHLLVTVGGASLTNAGELSGWLTQEIQKHENRGHTLMIQVHEEVAVGHVQPTRSLRNDLKSLGVSFGIDHIGDGVQSDLLVNQMMESPAVDFLKLGRTIMSELSSDKDRQNIIRNLVSKSSQQGGQVIAEHVENANTLAALYQLGVAYAQGSFLADPMSEMNHEF